ncbi:MAG: PaaI family thioesterase [Atopobiaceae bacterium]|nr:PaaI family thioesterase [Atopobiaceae bacterium]
MVSAHQSLEDIRKSFSRDNFATNACGCQIVEASEGHAVCEFTISENHLNAHEAVMGGAIFTLADFALAVSANVGKPPTVSVSNSIEFIGTAKGVRLIAKSDVLRESKSLGFYDVEVTDELGNLVARMTATCYRRS